MDIFAYEGKIKRESSAVLHMPAAPELQRGTSKPPPERPPDTADVVTVLGADELPPLRRGSSLHSDSPRVSERTCQREKVSVPGRAAGKRERAPSETATDLPLHTGSASPRPKQEPR